ncbi:unnamed protein product [Rhodiola kirilowii]
MSSRLVSLSMRTRTGFSYPHLNAFRRIIGKQRCDSINESNLNSRKHYRRESVPGDKIDHFDSLPDDIIISILCKLSSSADRPVELLNVLSTCKRLNGLGLNSLVLSKASRKMFAIKASNQSHSAHRFSKLAVESGNVEASYTLGMVSFSVSDSFL